MAGWKKLNEMKIIGKRYPRLNGRELVTGKAKYTFDIKRPGMLHGRVLRSLHPHAKVKSVDASKVLSLPGVKAVITDLKDEVLFVGDEVAAVAATNEQVAEEALRHFKVQYELLPFVVTEEEAMKEGSPKVFAEQESNIGKQWEDSSGDSDKGFSQADVVLERTYRTQVQSHVCLETHGSIAEWRGNELYMWSSAQGVHQFRIDIANYFKIPENDVHVDCQYIGGGFGSKIVAHSPDYIAARLAKKAHAPVKLMLTREEEFLSAGNRPSSVQKMKIGAKANGDLVAFESHAYGTAGIGGGPNIPQPYVFPIPNFKMEKHDVFTNAGPGDPMRAPGNPEASFAMNSLMDELAVKLNMDPLELMRKNDPNPIRLKEYEIGAQKIGWNQRHENGSETGVIRTGLGVGTAMWLGGGHMSYAIVSIFPDGSVNVKSGTQDLGTGIRTIIAAVAAEELGLEVSDIFPHIGKSDYPFAVFSAGSWTTPSISPAVKRASEEARKGLFELVAKELDTIADDLVAKNKMIFSKQHAERKMSWKEACSLLKGTPMMAFGAWTNELSDEGTAGCQFAKVEVNTMTGRVKVKKMVAVHDCGLVLNRLTTENQIKGAMIQALGYALFETRVLDQDTGVVTNANMESYKIPGVFEIPQFDVTIIDESSRGVIGIGEPPAIPGAAAISNAVANAIGVRIRELPITPEKVLSVLAKRKVG